MSVSFTVSAALRDPFVLSKLFLPLHLLLGSEFTQQSPLLQYSYVILRLHHWTCYSDWKMMCTNGK